MTGGHGLPLRQSRIVGGVLFIAVRCVDLVVLGEVVIDLDVDLFAVVVPADTEQVVGTVGGSNPAMRCGIQSLWCIGRAEESG